MVGRHGRCTSSLAGALKKKLPGCAVIYVSFNDYSNLAVWEKDNPLAALCRRIAFAAVVDREQGHVHEQYAAFSKMDVSEKDIEDWLAR